MLTGRSLNAARARDGGRRCACGRSSQLVRDTDASTAVCTEPKEVSCEDDLILTLGMQDFVSTGAVGTTQDGGDFLTTIDATPLAEADNVDEATLTTSLLT